MFAFKSLVIALAVTFVPFAAASASEIPSPYSARTATVTAEGATECAAVQGAKRRAEAAAGGTNFTVIRDNVRKVGNRWVCTWTIRVD